MRPQQHTPPTRDRQPHTRARTHTGPTNRHPPCGGSHVAQKQSPLTNKRMRGASPRHDTNTQTGATLDTQNTTPSGPRRPPLQSITRTTKETRTNLPPLRVPHRHATALPPPPRLGMRSHHPHLQAHSRRPTPMAYQQHGRSTQSMQQQPRQQTVAPTHTEHITRVVTN
jgi:hypothetical protein